MANRTIDIIVDGKKMGELRHHANSTHKKRRFVLVLNERSKWAGYALTPVQNFIEYAGELYQKDDRAKKKKLIYFTVHRNGDIDSQLDRAARYLMRNLRPI